MIPILGNHRLATPFYYIHQATLQIASTILHFLTTNVYNHVISCGIVGKMQLCITRLVNNPHHCITWLTTQNTCHVKRQCSFWDFIAWRARRNHGSFNNIHICPKLLLSNKLFWQNKREWAQFCQSEIGIIQLILDRHVADPFKCSHSMDLKTMHFTQQLTWWKL